MDINLLKKLCSMAASIYLTFEAMKEVNRPEGNESWQFYDSSKEIAWKVQEQVSEIKMRGL